MKGHATRSLFVVSTLAFLAIAALTHAKEIEVTVRVRVMDSSGEPIENALMTCRHEGGDFRGRTDGNGVATLTGMVDDSTTLLCLFANPLFTDGDPASRIFVTGAIDRYYSIDVAFPTSEYDFEIAADPAVTVSGRVVDESGRPLGKYVTVQRHNGPLFRVCDEDTGAFEFAGVEQGRAERLYIKWGTRGLWEFRDLPAELLQEDVDVGDIVLEDPPDETALAQVRLINTESLDPLMSVMDGRDLRVTLIRDDGGLVYDLRVGTGLLHRSFGDEKNVTSIAPGRYYVSLGMISWCDFSWRLHNEVLEGIQPETPVLEFRAGETTTATIDAGELESQLSERFGIR